MHTIWKSSIRNQWQANKKINFLIVFFTWEKTDSRKKIERKPFVKSMQILMSSIEKIVSINIVKMPR